MYPVFAIADLMDTLNAILPILENSGSTSGGPYSFLGMYKHVTTTYPMDVKCVLFMYNTNGVAEGPMHFHLCTSTFRYQRYGSGYFTDTISGNSIIHKEITSGSISNQYYNVSDGLVFV